MAGIDRIRPSDDQPDQPDAEAARPSWSDRWRAAQVARMDAEEAKLRQVFAEREDAGDNQTVAESDRSERGPQSGDAGGWPEGRGESRRPVTPDSHHPPTDASYRESDGQANDHTKGLDRSAGPAEARADEPDSPARDVTAPAGHADAVRGWQRLSEPGEHVPWEERLGGLGGPGKEVTSERRADDAGLERVQVQRLEQRPDATAEHHTGDPGQARPARPQSYHATTVAGTDAGAGSDTTGRHVDQTSSRLWWIETAERPADRGTERAPEITQQPRESTVGSGPPESEQPNAEGDAPMSWVSDAFKIPGGTRVAEGWSGFPVGDSRVGLAPDAPPFRDDFGPIDVERWGEVPCAAARPQRTYELRDSDAPLADDVVAALLEAKENVSEVLEEAAGRELTVEDVEEVMRHINPTLGGDNCVECSKAVDDVLRGHAAVAGPTDDQPPHFVDNVLSIRAIDYAENISPESIQRQLLEAGSGAHGIVIGWKNYGPSHAYNVANIEGDVYWLDGQKDIVASDNPHPNYVSYELYRTA